MPEQKHFTIIFYDTVIPAVPVGNVPFCRNVQPRQALFGRLCLAVRILLLAGCTQQEEGSLEDLPRETLDTLASMDWLPRDDANF